jgi:hypothetical protein
MRTVANLDYSRGGRCPVWLWVAPEEREVHNSFGWSDLDEFFEDVAPFSGEIVNTLENFVGLNCVVPVFFFRASDLEWLIRCMCKTKEIMLTS